MAGGLALFVLPQPHALAQAVHAYAVNINNLGALATPRRTPL